MKLSLLRYLSLFSHQRITFFLFFFILFVNEMHQSSVIHWDNLIVWPDCQFGRVRRHDVLPPFSAPGSTSLNF